jgi:hypothetical protein
MEGKSNYRRLTAREQVFKIESDRILRALAINLHNYIQSHN